MRVRAQEFKVFGYARSKMSNEEFRTLINNTLTCRIDAKYVNLVADSRYVLVCCITREVQSPAAVCSAKSGVQSLKVECSARCSVLS